jgi:hypothetical protein
MSKALASVLLPACRALCAAARSPSTQSFNSARSAVCLAPTRLGYLLDTASPCRSRRTLNFAGMPWTPDLADTWAQAYGLVAKVMVAAAEEREDIAPADWEAGSHATCEV